MPKPHPAPDFLTWRNETRRLSELVPWDRNPRQIKDAEAKRLGESLLQFGQVQTIAIGPDNSILDGHQRALVWSLLQEGGDREVDVRVSSRALTEKEREKLVVYLHRGATGSWDFEALANGFDFDELVEWGFDAGELVGFDVSEESADEFYTAKIENPIYTPSDQKPFLSDCYDNLKTKQLIDNINATEGLSDDERDFLIIAANRHTILDFSKIADYYAHSGQEMKRLMEDNALVIIDFNKAIENGFIIMSKDITDLYNSEYPDEK